MSNRTILEINHDMWHVIDKDKIRFAELLVYALGGGGKMQWEDLEQFGIKRIEMMHHSTPASLNVNGRIVEIRK